MKKLGFLFAAAMIISHAAFATQGGSNYTNAAVALAETAVAASWATQPQIKALEIDNSALERKVQIANERLNEQLEQRMTEKLQSVMFQ